MFNAPSESPMQANMPISGWPTSASTTMLASPRQEATITDRRRFVAASTTGGAATGCTGNLSNSILHETAELNDGVVNPRGEAEGEAH